MKKSPIWRKIIAIIALWVSFLIGGTVLVNLINLFSLGGGYKPGDLGWYLVGIAGGPVGVGLGKAALDKLTEPGEYIFRAVNYVVVAVFAVFVGAFNLLAGRFDLYYLLLEAAIAIAAASFAANEFKEMGENNGHNT